MKRTLFSVVLLSVFCLCFYGCGGDTGGIYTTDVTFSDAGNDDVLSLDVTRDICTPATATAPADLEDFTDVYANITITVAEELPGITINSYSIEYLPLTSVDELSNPVTPPDLEPLIDQTGSGSNNLHIDTNSSHTFSIECFSTSQKDEFSSLRGATYTARYTIRIVLHCTDDSGYDRNLEIRRTVYLDDYDNC